MVNEIYNKREIEIHEVTYSFQDVVGTFGCQPDTIPNSYDKMPAQKS